MDHVVCLDAIASELENLVNGNKSMILRSSDAMVLPYGSVHKGDILYFINSDGDGEVKARGIVSYVFNSGKLSVEESFETIIRNQDKLQLPDKQFEKWAGKRYLVLIGVDDIEVIEPIIIDLTRFTFSPDWLKVEDIKIVALKQG